MNNDTTDRPILYFDGVCNLCNGVVQFIIRHDRKKKFLFASLQSAAGQQVLHQFGGNTPDSIILSYHGKYLVRSDAALMVFKLLGVAWALLFVLKVVPGFVRDGVYNLVARKRYQWFGKRGECMMPTAELQKRFL